MRFALRSWSGALLSALCVLTGMGIGMMPTVQADGPALATHETPDGLIIRKNAEGKWGIVRQKEQLTANEILIGGPGANLVSANGAVGVSFIGDLIGASPFPILESAIALKEVQGADLGLVLLRGRINLTNLKKEGSAVVRTSGRKGEAESVLKTPGSSLAIEIYGRWPRGAKFEKNPKADHVPAVALVAISLKGEVHLKSRDHEVVLKEPPGPAMVMSENIAESLPAIHHLDALPEWAVPHKANDPLSQARRKSIAKLRQLLVEVGVEKAADLMIASEDPNDRRIGMVLSGATDDLENLGKALVDSKYPDNHESAILVLRHWIGREPGQDQKLYKALIEKAGFPPNQAEIVLQLLHSFGPDELCHAETYETLIDYLESDRLPIRILADWHLRRLLPEGAKLGYDPLAAPEQRAKIAREWRKLIPTDRPSKPATKDSN